MEVTLTGDVLLAAAFVSYVGAFGAEYRQRLWSEVWVGDLVSREVPMTTGVDPVMSILTDDARIAEWNNENLPSDRISIENGAIITASSRWPLIIDPQLQGITWILSHEEKRAAAAGTKVVKMQLGEKGWMNKIIDAITNGNTVIIENLGEEIDAVLDPVLARAVFRKGRNLFLKLGGEEIECCTRGRRGNSFISRPAAFGPVSTTRTLRSTCRRSSPTRTTSRRSPRSAR